MPAVAPEMTKDELRDHYVGVRHETKNEIRRLNVILKMIDEQMAIANKASKHRVWARWGYVHRILQDKILNCEVVIKMCRVRRKKPVVKTPT